MRRLLLCAACLVGALALAAASRGALQLHSVRGANVGVTYRAGWNLVGGPDGTSFGGAGNAYTFAAGDSAYESAPAVTPVTGGKGYWVYFAADTSVSLNGAGVGTLRQTLPAGQFVMIGNPSGVQAVGVSGADEVLTDDPASGYAPATQLAVGQGAWALANAGGTLTLTAVGTPLPIPTATPTPSPTPAQDHPPGRCRCPPTAKAASLWGRERSATSHRYRRLRSAASNRACR